MTATTALERLRAAADTVHGGWVPERWKREGDGAEVRMSLTPFMDVRLGAFEELGLAPGADVTVTTTVDVPAVLHGVPVAGDALELTLHSLFPMQVRADGRVVFEDDLPPVAAGPASFTVVDSLDPAAGHELSVRVVAPDAQIAAAWCYLHFTTPGLHRRFLALDTAWAQLYVADALAGAGAGADHKVVEAAAELVPADLLALDEEALTAALAGMANALEPLAKRAEALRVHLVGHSHIDLAWLWRWDDTRRVIVRDARSVLELMEDYPELCFTHSQPAGYESLRADAPDLYAAVCDRIAEGRWEAATMQWAEGDVNLATGEAQARQLLEGVRYTQSRLGTTPSVFLAPDTFGHAGNLPQLAASAGARAYYHHRGNPGNQHGGDPWPAYWWEGDDGTRLLALSTPSYNWIELTPRAIATAAVARGLRAGLPSALHFIGVGDHGGGPTRQSMENLRALQGVPGLPTARCSTLGAYADEVLASGAPLPSAPGETNTIFEGCYTTHVDTKRLNREGEDLLVTADALTAVAGVDGHRLALQGAWQTVLLHQFHDILCGSAIAEVYADQADAATGVRAAAQRAIDASLAVLHEGLPVGAIAVTNPLAVDRTDAVVAPVAVPVAGAAAVWVEDLESGERVVGQATADGVVFVAQVPALGTRAYRIVEGQPDVAPLAVAWRDALGRPGVRFLTVSAGPFEAELRSDCGVLTSLVDRRTGRDLVAWGHVRGSDYTDDARPDLALGTLQLVEEHPHAMSSWQHMEVFRETSILRGAQTEVVEHGPVRVVVEVRTTVGSSPVVERWTFWRDLPRVDLAIDVDWQEPGGPDVGVPNLKVAFTAAVDQPAAWYETPFGAARRPADGQQVPALRWAALAGRESGLAVLNDGTHGHDTMGHRLRLTVVRTAYEPDSRSDQGPVSARYALVPFVGDWRDADLTAAAAGWNQPLLARVVSPSSGAVASTSAARPRPHVRGAGVVISAVKHGHDDGRFVVRLAETTGTARSVTLDGLPPGPAWDATVTEDLIDALPRATETDGAIALALRPWQVRTVIVTTVGERA
jgi:alpha-mannosidase